LLRYTAFKRPLERINNSSPRTIWWCIELILNPLTISLVDNGAPRLPEKQVSLQLRDAFSDL